jgi:hypothetical protein
MPPGVGALTEGDGRNFMLLMDMSRYLVNEITQEHDFKDVNDASRLRIERLDLTAELTAKMWSYWHMAPAGPGVFENLLTWCKAQISSITSVHNRELGQQRRANGQMTSAIHLLASNELRAWPRQRITARFIFAKEASDGSALLVPLGPDSQPLLTVYKVQGISTSLGDLLRAKGQSLPQCLGLTLLPFMGAIVYDGTLRGMPLPPHLTGPVLTEVYAIIEQATQQGTMVSALPTPVDAPLEGKHVRISGLQAKPELNGQVASAGDYDAAKGRYAVRLGNGTVVALKPANLVEASEEEVAASAPAGTLVGAELTPLQQEIQDEIRKTKPMGPGEMTPGPDGAPADMDMWVFRRRGYTEQQNPEHVFMVMAGALPIPAYDGPRVPAGADPMMAMMMSGMSERDIWHKSSNLIPTVDDILQALRSALKNPMWGRGKPKYVAVDAKQIVDRLEEILKPAGIQAGYYPPPSNEELMHIPGSDLGGGV